MGTWIRFVRVEVIRPRYSSAPNSGKRSDVALPMPDVKQFVGVWAADD